MNFFLRDRFFDQDRVRSTNQIAAQLSPTHQAIVVTPAESNQRPTIHLCRGRAYALPIRGSRA
jgi:hypothetical protein